MKVATREKHPNGGEVLAFATFVSFLFLFTTVTVTLLTVLSTLLEGWVLTYMWAWFVMPFTGWQALGVGIATGMVVTTRLLTRQLITGTNTLMALLIHLYLKPLGALALGWFVVNYVVPYFGG
jgi:hypothetical protein